MHRLQHHLQRKRAGHRSGIYSVCSAHPFVLRAAAEQAVADGSLLLIEATSNQVNQFGGYTGLRPRDFRELAEEIAANAGLALQNLVLGGDHLGPNPWQKLPAEQALAHGEEMIAEYVSAGFTKIHLDASMSCAGDGEHLSDQEVALRAVRLCRAAEAARTGGEDPVYIIGTEVPVPGGAAHVIDELQVTPVESAARTLEIHRKAFFEAGLGSVWPRVIAMVVQPGVEFDHDSVVDYESQKASALATWLDQQEAIVFEAHSTDYQKRNAYQRLVQDGFQILKVGPALTFAMREAMYALEAIEKQLTPAWERSNLSDVVEASMLAHPEHWRSHYSGSESQLKLMRIYSYSDRVRYYWQESTVIRSIERLIANLQNRIPISMLSQFLPMQYSRVRNKELANQPMDLIVDKVRDTLRDYASACVLPSEAHITG
jgi:D-tagatose-1,6-bisphosphate aldolase subunit GatZ/KbaZ